jgi:hypothetical protein
MLWQLLIPAFDRFVPNHVISDFLALSLHPLFRRPRGRNGNRQQEDRAEDGDRNALRRRPRRIDVGSATRTCIVCDRLFSLRWIHPILADRQGSGQCPNVYRFRYTLHHYRDKDQDEVDIIVENEHGAMVGIEVNASATVHASDFKGLRKLFDISGDDLRLRVVTYDGAKVVPFGERLFASNVLSMDLTSFMPWKRSTGGPLHSPLIQARR